MSFKYELVSAYNDMLDIKVSLGFSRHNYTSHILPFIDFCTNKYPDASEITKDMLDQWLVSKSFNTDNTRRLAIINIRHFARYLNATGMHAYVPSSEYNVMSTEETALALGVSTKTVYRLLRDNKISHIKMGRTYRVPKAHLFSFLCLVSSECNSI